jgi:N-acetylmuramoyl-L-alanine amidase
MRSKYFRSVGKLLNPYNLYKTKRPIDLISVHCSAEPYGRNTRAKTIDGWHRARRWAGIGYHLVVTSNATLEKGRWFDKVPSAIRGRNRRNIAVCFIGGLDNTMAMDFDNMPHYMETTLVETLATLQLNYPNAKIEGHNETNGVSKDCPCIDMDKIRYKVRKAINNR